MYDKMKDNETLKYEVFGTPNTVKILKKSLKSKNLRDFLGVRKSKAFSTCKNEVFAVTELCSVNIRKSRFSNVSCSRVQRKILEVLYKQRRRCSAGVREEFLMKKMEERINNSELRVHVDYLKEKGYITIKSVYDSFVTIT